jgi:hypothetical protein
MYDYLIRDPIIRLCDIVGEFFLGDYIGDKTSVGFFMIVMVGGLLFTYMIGGKRRVR